MKVLTNISFVVTACRVPGTRHYCFSYLKRTKEIKIKMLSFSGKKRNVLLNERLKHETSKETQYLTSANSIVAPLSVTKTTGFRT